jgi:hypothetical protein
MAGRTDGSLNCMEVLSMANFVFLNSCFCKLTCRTTALYIHTRYERADTPRQGGRAGSFGRCICLDFSRSLTLPEVY